MQDCGGRRVTAPTLRLALKRTFIEIRISCPNYLDEKFYSARLAESSIVSVGYGYFWKEALGTLMLIFPPTT